MHTHEFVLTAGIALTMTLTYVVAAWVRSGRKKAPNGAAKLLPPDEFCRQVLSHKPQRMVILHVGDACAGAGKGRRYEFRAETPAAGRSFRTYFDDASRPGNEPRRQASPNARRTAGSIRLLMQAAEWHADRRKGTLINPAFYLEL